MAIKVPIGDPLKDVNVVKTPEELAQEAADIEAARIAQEAADAEAERLRIEAANNVPNSSNKIVFETPDGNIEATLNDAGDAVNADGTVLYTAAEIAVFSAPEEDIITQAAKLSGIIVLDTEGNPKVYENTAEGLAQRESDIKRLGYIEAETKAVSTWLQKNPDLASMYEYKRIHGTLEGFNTFVDYTEVTIDPADIDQQYTIVYTAEIQRGSSPERAKKLADYAKADNTLFADATDSLKYLETIQSKQIESVTAREKAAEIAAIEAENNYFGIAYDQNGKEKVLNVEGSIYDMVVTKGAIGNLRIPIEGVTIKDPKGSPKTYTRREIFDYINTPVKEIDGELYSQAQLDEFKRVSNKNELVSTYIKNLFGGNLDSLISTTKLQDKANEVRIIKTSSKSSSNSSSSNPGRVVIPVGKKT